MCNNFYSGIKEYADSEYFDITEVNYQGITFLKLTLKRGLVNILLGKELIISNFEFLVRWVAQSSISILFPKDIDNIAARGLLREENTFFYIDTENLYIDNDLIGMSIK